MEYRLVYLTDLAQMTRLGAEGWKVVPGIITRDSAQQVLMERETKLQRFCAHCRAELCSLCSSCITRVKT